MPNDIYIKMRVTKDIGCRKHVKEPNENDSIAITKEDIEYLNTFVMDSDSKIKEERNETTNQKFENKDTRESPNDKINRMERVMEAMEKRILELDGHINK